MVVDEIEDPPREELHGYIEVACVFGTQCQGVFCETILWHAADGGGKDTVLSSGEWGRVGVVDGEIGPLDEL